MIFNFKNLIFQNIFCEVFDSQNKQMSKTGANKLQKLILRETKIKFSGLKLSINKLL